MPFSPKLPQKIQKIAIQIGYFCIGILALLLILSILIIRPLDRTPYQEMDFYAHTLQNLQKVVKKTQVDNKNTNIWQIGWAKVNITPQKPIELTGYLNRPSREYNCVLDSVFVRTFVFDNGQTQVAIISLDLLIVPPDIVNATKQALKGTKFNPQNLYFSATHTHSSIGGWGNNWLGYFLAGKYRPELVQNIAQKIVKSIILAQKQQQEASIGFAKMLTKRLVFNRIVGYKGETDSWLRVIKIQQKTGKTAVILSYAAHPTCLSEKTTCIAGDYPADMIQQIEQKGDIQMAAFVAGAMASQGAFRIGNQPDEQHKNRIATKLAQMLIQQHTKIPLKPLQEAIWIFKIPIEVRKPHFRIAQNWVIDTWVFEQIYGKQQPFVQVLQLANIVLIGMPCDFSGELVAQFEPLCQQKKINLILTSFNGAYIGYVTKDEWYDLPRYETYDMAWHGPQNGSYFSEIIYKILEKL